MDKGANQTPIEKFLNLGVSKQNRIVNAAMKEFRYGYKKATMDMIVKDAGISKGLLFHYFGTKQQLYIYLVNLASDVIHKDYFQMINLGNNDILESFWQMALTKQNTANQYPYVYEFINSIYIHSDDIPGDEIPALIKEKYQAVIDAIYQQCDKELFRQDIDHKKAIDIISLSIDGIIEEEANAKSSGGWSDEKYDEFLENLREYIDIFRTCFYR